MTGKINIDFEVYDSNNPYSFIVLDTSEWLHISEKPSIIEIIPPGETKPVTNYFYKNSVNVFNSVNLGLNCGECLQPTVELPDGIYEITVKGSPDKFNSHRSYLKTTNTRLKLDKVLIGLSLECFRSDDNELKAKIKQIDMIDLMLKSAEANVRYGNDCVAQELLYEAQKLIEQMGKCNDCV